MAYTYDNDFAEMPVGAVEWPAVFNDLVYKVEAGRKLKVLAQEALVAGDPVYISSTGAAYKATDTTPFSGIWVSASTAIGVEGFVQVSGRVTITGWALSAGPNFVTSTSTLTTAAGTHYAPAVYVISGQSTDTAIVMPAYGGINQVKISTGNTLGTPATSSDTGAVGDFTFDANYAYFCVAANTWKRVALTAF